MTMGMVMMVMMIMMMLMPVALLVGANGVGIDAVHQVDSQVAMMLQIFDHDDGAR